MGIRPRPSQMRAFSIEAERRVAELLERRGWRILARNFRHIGFEIDLIAGKEKSLVAVEVKARRTKAAAWFEPQALLGVKKRAALIRGLNCFVSQKVAETAAFEHLRLDLAVVVPGLGQVSPLVVHYFPNV